MLTDIDDIVTFFGMRAGQTSAQEEGHPVIVPGEQQKPPWQLSTQQKEKMTERWSKIKVPLGKNKPPNVVKYTKLKAADWVTMQGDDDSKSTTRSMFIESIACHASSALG